MLHLTPKLLVNEARNYHETSDSHFTLFNAKI